MYFDRPSPNPRDAVSILSLHPTMASHAMSLGENFSDPAVLFNDPGLSDADVQYYPLTMVWESLKLETSAYLIDRSLCAMVYKRGDYRRKLWSLFEQYQSKTNQHTDSLHCDRCVDGDIPPHGSALDDASRFVDGSRFVDALPGEQGMRAFFASGNTNLNFQSFLSIVPGLEKVLDEADYLEDAVDFGPFIEELKLKH